jgi:hypothetical protein
MNPTPLVWHFGNAGRKTRCGKRAARRWHVTTLQDWFDLSMRNAEMCGTCIEAVQNDSNVPHEIRHYAWRQ